MTAVAFYLALISLANVDTLAPRIFSPHKTLIECQDAARTATFENRVDLGSELGISMGLTFVCLELKGQA